MNGRHSAGARMGREEVSPLKSLRNREKGKAVASTSAERTRKGARAPAQPCLRPEDVTEETIEGERTSLLAKKQVELQVIFDKHDDMLRELYQMHTYKLMLAYDPQAVKSENTPAFTEWKAQYDLLDKVTPQAGPSRRTRGTRSEQLSLVSGLSVSPTKPPPKTTSRTSKAQTKLPFEAIHGIISATVGKLHEREKRAPQEKPQEKPIESAKVEVKGSVVSSSAPRPSPKQTRGKTQRERTVLSAIDVDQSGQTITPPVAAPPAARTRSKDHALVKSISVTGQPAARVDVPAPGLGHESISVALGRRSSRLRGEIEEEPPSKKPRVMVEMPMTEVASRSSALPPKAVVKTTKTGEPPKEPEQTVLISPPIPVSSPLIKIKRVKLLVRRPPPSFSHHRQRPPPPKHGASLSKFLSTYKTLGDQDVDEAKIARQALHDARIRNQEAEFRRQGRFIPGTDVLFGSDPNTLPYEPPKRTTRDVWDDIVDIITTTRSKVPKKFLGQQIAGQIASKVQAYWDTQELKKDRARAQEEKRLRALAKATMKMVIAEWKKVVYHVREQERLKVEAEERRLGHEHLDAILDQSGQLLETQQGDLRRARSRCASMDIGLDGWNEEGEEEEEETEDGSFGGSDDEGVDGTDAASEIQTEDVDEGIQPSTQEPSEAGEEAQEEEEEEEEEEEAEEEAEEREHSTALLLGPVTRSPAEIPEVSEEEQEMVNMQDVEGAQRAGSPSQAGTPMTQETGEGYQTESRVSVLPSSPTQPTEVLSSERELSKEVDNVPPEPQPPAEDVDEEMGQGGGRLEHVSLLPDGTLEGENVVAAPQEEEEEEAIPLRAEEEEEEEEKEKETAEEEKGQEEAVLEKEETILPPSEAPEGDNAKVEQEVGKEEADEGQAIETQPTSESRLPDYLQSFAVAQVEWHVEEKIKPPLLLRGVLRPYQQSGLEWLASLHSNNLNGILADEMGLGKTIQTISLLAHLACDRGIWGPHLIIVPTSVLLNWEMEFKKFLPGFKVLSYHGTTKRRKELRQGWNDKYHFNVCITSYTLASRDAHIFKRKPWYYMVLDEAHMIKNFKSQRWNILLMFRSFRRLLLTGTPLQNNLTELWALLQFLMSGSSFANLKEFGDWFSNPLEKAIEMGNVLDDETMQRVTKLHTVLRPYLLRRLKRDVEKELPSKFEHLVLCPLSKRQRFLYDEFMSRAQTRNDLASGIYQKIANILMQLRKVCNHPDLFEVRPIVTSFAMQRSAIADFEIKELLIRKRWLEAEDERVNLDLLGYQFIDQQDEPLLTAVETRRLSASSQMPRINDLPGEPPPKDTRTTTGYRRYKAYMQEVDEISRWKHIAYLNELRCCRQPVYSSETLSAVKRLHKPLIPLSEMDLRHDYMDIVRPVHQAVLSYNARANTMADELNKFVFVTPSVVAMDLPRLTLGAYEAQLTSLPLDFDCILHPISVKLQIAFPDPSLLQYDCGKLQQLTVLLQEKKAGGHRVLIFTQMTRILDILEIFLNLHGYLYLRLDGATKIEDRQYITERFNADPRIFCFIASSRSGGVGINLTGADTVIFYDSDFNPQMDKQCEDRAHRIGQIRDVHIYRFVSQHTVEEAMLRKADQKRSLDDIVIQKGEFDWRTIFSDESGGGDTSGSAVTALTKALGEFEDAEDARAAALAAREEYVMEGADNADFGAEGGESTSGLRSRSRTTANEGDQTPVEVQPPVEMEAEGEGEGEGEGEQEEEGGAVVDYMLTVVQREYDFFKDWRL